jgi:mRNA interferase MazF
VKNFDELIDEKSASFIQSGLRQSSLIRLGFLAVIPHNKIHGTIGRIGSGLHRNLVERLAKYLLKIGVD